VSLALALVALWLSDRPATLQRSFGLKRAEVLAALANGVTLVAVAIWVFIEAAQRFRDPPPVLGGWMLLVAAVGLLVNIAAALVLLGPRRGNLNLEAAFRHVLGDLAGSVGTLVAAAVILATGWLYADPIAGVLIAVLILLSSWTVLRDSVRILLEAAPAGIDVTEVERELKALPGVIGVHDLHIWTITSGFPAVSAHLIVEESADAAYCRGAAAELLHKGFGIEHSTLQVEADGEDPACTLLSCGRQVNGARRMPRSGLPKVEPDAADSMVRRR
jgi:cobalt-zinc-cadmium efflux system protein